MVDNPAEKINRVSANRGCWVVLAYNWDRENCPLYGVAGCPLFRGCLSIEVNGRTVGTFRIARYIIDVRFSGVSVKRGSTVLNIKNWVSGDCLLQLHTGGSPRKKLKVKLFPCMFKALHHLVLSPDTIERPIKLQSDVHWNNAETREQALQSYHLKWY